MTTIVTRAGKGSALTWTEADANFNNLNTFDLGWTGQVAREMDEKSGDIISVKDFGAVGDGITDDSTAIQNALNYARNFPTEDRTGVVWFPPGTYILASGVTRRAGVLMLGAGFEATILKYTASSGAAITAANDSAGGGIEGISIDGSAATGTAYALSLTTVINLNFTNCAFENFATASATVQMSGLGYINVFKRCWFRNNTRHFLAAPGAGVSAFQTNISFEYCLFEGADSSATLPAIQIQDALAFSFYRCIFQSNATITTIKMDRTDVTKLVPSFDHIIRDCYFEDNGGSQAGSREIYFLSTIGIGTPATGLVVTGCTFHQSGVDLPTNHIEIANSTGVVTRDNSAPAGAGKFILDGTNNSSYLYDNMAVIMASDLSSRGTWTPVVTSGVGTITAYTATGTYNRIGDLVTIQATIVITTAGTANGTMVITLPFTGANFAQTGSGSEISTGVSISMACRMPANATQIFVDKYDGTALWGNGYTYYVSATYMI